MLSTRHEATRSRNYSLELKGIDYIEFYVGNANHTAHFYRSTFGFAPLAYTGLETGVRDRTTLVIEQRNICLALTSPLGPDGEIADHIKLHGDGVKDIAFTVEDAVGAFEEAVRRGARPVTEPTVIEDASGKVIKATIAAFGDTVHSFIERNNYKGAFLPNYRTFDTGTGRDTLGLAAIDHVAVTAEPGKLDEWVDFYNNVLGFHQSHQEDVSTEYSAMNSKVVQNGNGRIKFPIVEPAPGRRKSQIEEYLAFYGGPGTQHVALLSSDILQAVRELRASGVEFLKVPDTYYDVLESRVGSIDEDLDTLRELNILVDRDASGYLMQVFTKPVQSRPTVFLEVIQRKGASGFGGGNIKALFESVEREQALRGNL
jgi:4-hydroxyphenylpyruvate dioxygenase